MVVALPALHLVEEAFPKAERRMLTNFPVGHQAAAAAAVLGDAGIVQGYFEYPVGARGFGVLLSLWWKLMRWRPQVVVYLAAARGVETARRDAAFFLTLGFPRMIGLPLTEYMQKCRPIPEDDRLEAECDRLGRNLGELGEVRSDRAESWDLRLTDGEHERAAEVLAPAGGRPVMMFSLGTKVQANDWGKKRWRELMGRLGKMYPGLALAFTGVPAESELSEYVAAGWREGAGAESLVLNLCGMLTPRESAACFARAELFLGHDSGPMHLASSVGTRVVAVFSARNLPGVWFPILKPTRGEHALIYHAVDCMGCRLTTCVVEKKKCIEGITVDEVMAAVERMLGAGE